MATNNFHYVNTSKCYSFSDECIESFGEYEWFIESLSEDLKYKLKDFIEKDDINDPYGLRSYPSVSLGYIHDYFEYLDIEVPVTFNIFLRSGYYEGACLDYSLEMEGTEGETFDDIDDLINDFREWHDMFRGVDDVELEKHLKILKANLELFINSQVELIEKTFEDISTPLNVVGRFSNGETIYEGVK